MAKAKEITSRSELGELSVVQVQTQFALVVRAIHEAQGLPQIEQIRDQALQVEAFLRTRAAATAMGDQIEALRAELRNIRVLADIRQGEITQAIHPAAKRDEAVAALGVSKVQATTCAHAAMVAPEVREALLAAAKKRGLAVTTRDIARVHTRTYTDAQREHVAKSYTLGLTATIEDAIRLAHVEAPISSTSTLGRELQADLAKRQQQAHNNVKREASKSRIEVQKLARDLSIEYGRLATMITKVGSGDKDAKVFDALDHSAKAVHKLVDSIQTCSDWIRADG